MWIKKAKAELTKRISVKTSLSLIFMLFVMVAIVLLWTVKINKLEFQNNHYKIAVQSVKGSATEIRLLISSLQTSLNLMVHGHNNLFEKLAKNPDDTAAHDIISKLMGKYFPDFYAFTIADSEGNVVYDDFEEQVGALCRSDLRKFVKNNLSHDLYVHPGPGKYHFDIMLKLNYKNQKPGVLFVSFELNSIARILSSAQTPGHNLYLLRQDVKDLIEVSAKGSRDKLPLPFKLTTTEMQSAFYQIPVRGTRWNLVDLPDKTLFSQHAYHQYLHFGWLLSLFGLICILMFIRINREQKRRLAAENALRQSCIDLECRVKQRTQDLLNVNTDLQAQIEETKAIEQQKNKLYQAIEQTEDSIEIANRQGIIEYVNPAYLHQTGLELDEILGKPSNEIKPSKKQGFHSHLWKSITSGNTYRDVFVNYHQDKSEYYEEKTISPVRNDNGDITHFVATGKDITEQVRVRERMAFLAHHDTLTELPNRLLLKEQLESALVRADKNELLCAIFFIDLDRFKHINDSLGHNIGDELLKLAASRLSTCIRKIDFLARLGGDEFIVILQDIPQINSVINIANKILSAFSAPFKVQSHELFCSTSIGITIYPFDDKNEDEDTLLKNAGTAMYRAKSSGGNSYKFFSSNMRKSAELRITMENALHYALDRNEFEIYYQPRVNIHDHMVTGVEALLRWNNPVLGSVPPDVFIPILEESGKINAVSEWVLRTACMDIRGLSGNYFPNLRLAVNLSPIQFRNKELYSMFIEVLKETHMEPGRLDIEITESLLIDSVSTVARTLTSFHNLGIKIAIDDFGTGYSALSYLKDFPIDCLKVDKSFVMDLFNREGNTELVRAIIAMAHSLQLNVVAEGVETIDHLNYLHKLKCEEVQGYLFSRPIPIKELNIWLKSLENLFTEKFYCFNKNKRAG